MPLAVKVPREKGEEVRRKLIELGLFNRDYRIGREGDYLLIPVVEPVEGFETVEVELEPVRRRPHSYQEVVRVPKELRPSLPSSFDIVGDIAIIELPEELVPYGKEIGRAIMEVHRHIRAVFAKGGKVGGEFRVRPLIHLAGEKKTETIHRENGIRLKLDIAKVYFSPRLATERRRIFERTQPGEVVFDMFAGVGPFSILLAKKAKLVFACDINPWAVKYLDENKRLNKIPNVVPVLGDVRKVAGQIKADRVIMNLPGHARAFLKEAMLSVRDGGVIHYYGFSPEEDLFGKHEEAIRDVAEELGLEVEFLDRRRIRNYAPRQYNVAIDFRVYVRSPQVQ
ncbi:tRNA (guanine(37)-N1)-methyltransferase Trm5b [Pyrococcus yayanosii]|uniref:tRNA (guanine(37)-N(1))-methyltransferase Trm5b n=1 Tax=Pyrococcus yayanosii (strain CH1 / JCM 16557) TaxID=529709 RepID=F8AF65_PYRYC|nr:class I SAM-dependent methyltransferase family protein [Pyrococcus yayanosii]AEH24893.1 Met-10+ like protein [Pyrococcus yayanosii CH1]